MRPTDPARRRALPFVAAAIAAAGLASCQGGLRAPTIGAIAETKQHGYIISPTALEQVPVGSSRDQVLIALGSPSTTAEFGGEVFYYISQTRRKAAKFMLSEIVDQRVVAVYFGRAGRVERLADYSLKDGKVFDFVTQTTPTVGKDLGFLQQVLQGGPSLMGGRSQG